jgi:hypothetical protein
MKKNIKKEDSVQGTIFSKLGKKPEKRGIAPGVHLRTK